MKKQIKRISILQSSKVLAILSCILSALTMIPLGLYELYHQSYELAKEFFLQPLIYLVAGFITLLITFLFYNLVAKAFGGIEIETDDKE